MAMVLSTTGRKKLALQKGLVSSEHECWKSEKRVGALQLLGNFQEPTLDKQ